MLDAGLYPYGTLPEAMLPDYAIEAGALVRPVLTDAGTPRAAVVLVTLAARAPGGLATSAPLPLVARAALDADVEVTRTQTPTGAVALMQIADAEWQEVAADAPRYEWPTQALRIDGGSTNSVTNPRGEGASGSTMPTGWTLNNARGLTHTWTRVTRGGIDGVDWRMVGTPNSTAASDLGFEAGETASAGITNVLSVFHQLVAGTLPFSVMELRNAAETTSSATDFVPTATLARVDNVRTNAGTAYRCRLTIAYASTASPVDCTVFLGLPQRRMSATAADAALAPVAATPTATARGIDVPIWTPGAFPRRGCIVVRGIYDAAAGASALGLLQLDNGTDDHRVVARIAAGGLQPEALVVSGGVTTATLAQTGSLVAGVPFVALVAWSPGGIRFGTSAGGVSSATIAMPSGVSRVVLGHANAAGTLPMVGTMTADFYEFWPSVAEATALISA